MYIDAELFFLEKRAFNGCPVSMYRFFKQWVKEDMPANYTRAVTVILKRFLKYYNPKRCMSYIAKSENTTCREYLIGEYQFIYNTIAAIHLDHKDYMAGSIWAKKAMDSIDILYPYYNIPTREKMKMSTSSFVLFECHKEHFDYSLYEQLGFDWEFEDYMEMRRNTANNNKRRHFQLVY